MGSSSVLSTPPLLQLPKAVGLTLTRCATSNLAQPPKPKRKRTTSALALEKAPKHPAPTLHTLNEKLEGLSEIVRGMEKSKNLRDKLIEGMDK